MIIRGDGAAPNYERVPGPVIIHPPPSDHSHARRYNDGRGLGKFLRPSAKEARVRVGRLRFSLTRTAGPRRSRVFGKREREAHSFQSALPHTHHPPTPRLTRPSDHSSMRFPRCFLAGPRCLARSPRRSDADEVLSGLPLQGPSYDEPTIVFSILLR
jgi:hypothetical protein